MIPASRAVPITSPFATLPETIACAVAALTVYDMVKGLERGVAVEAVVLLEKTGGRSDWRLEDAG
jgi:molybdenum cofactor biosynthesis enzyme